MVKGVSEDAVYYALIILFLGATLYLLSPLFIRQAPPTPSNLVITSPVNYSLVNLTILTSPRCKAFCDYSQVEATLKKLLVNVDVRRVDVDSTEGKRLAELNGVSLVPAYFFDSSLARSQAFAGFSNYTRRTDYGYVLRTLEASSGFLFKNEPTSTPLVQFFTTSYDPPSLNFENITFNVLAKLNDSVNFSVNYVVSDSNGKFSSVNGPVELVEDSIHLCALDLYGQNALNGIECRTREILLCYNTSSAVPFCAQFWKPCFQGWSMDAAAIEQCVKTRNETLLAKAAVIAVNNSIQAVPTMLINNQYRVIGQLTEFELFSSLCAIYPSSAGCTVRIGNT